MRFFLDTHYTPEEWDFIREHHCEVLGEVKLRRVAFPEVPRRMLRYGGVTLGEVPEDGAWCWAVLDRDRKGAWVLSALYPDLPSLAEGL